MSNLGFADLRLVNPYSVAYQEARSAVGAAALLRNSREFATVADAVSDRTLIVGTTDVAHRHPEHTIRRLEQAAPLLRKARRAALLFGSEKFGLSNDDMSHCHWLLRIPTRKEHSSMNLGQAVAVCLYEMIRSGQAARRVVEPRKPPAAGDVERFTNLLVEALQISGYLKPATAGSMILKVRRMVRRMNLSEHDTMLWQGMIRQLLWKLGQGERPPAPAQD